VSAAAARSGVADLARAALLVAPTVLAFFAGGYFDAPRIWTGLVMWVLVAVAMLVRPRPLRDGPGVKLALGGMSLLAAWTLASYTWAPEAGPAYHAGQRVVLYAGVLLAAVALLQTRGAQRAVEPALAAGTVVVIGYGISGRLLPGVLHFAHSVSAQGRLEQPLTYWNAMGELAALGAVLAVRLVGDASRGRGTRVAAATAIAPLGMGLYLSFSRGALFACAAGLVALLVAAPQRTQLRGLGLGLATGVLGALASAPFAGVTSLAGPLGTRERQGAIALALVLVVMAAAALAQLRLQRDEPEPDAERTLPRRAPAIALVVICAGLALAIVAGAKETSAQPLGAGAGRLETLQSNRYAYWRVALRAFADEPLRGVGAGGWAVYWLAQRPFNEGAQDAHSLELQTAAELGVIGLALLAAFLAGVGIAARTAHRVDPALAAGPLAAFVSWVAHSPLDWDWQMPAVTMVAVILAGTLLAAAGGRHGRVALAPLHSTPPAVGEAAR
jgi:O-antigen ligase